LQEDVFDIPFPRPINLLIDATFFGREYGFLVFHDCNKVIYFKEIKTESIQHFREGLIAVRDCGYYTINSITVDGRRGYINNIRKLLGNIPIQMCIFHQKAIVRRYITDRPRSEVGIKLKNIMNNLCKSNCSELHQEFIDQFYALKDQYHYILQQKNSEGNYKYSNIRSAFRSIDQNMIYLFTYSDHHYQNIPPTNNHLEGLFGHLKERE
jgi:hypothetical protein